MRTNTPHIHIRLLNEGQREITNAFVKMGSYVTISGGLAQDGSLMHLYFDHPLKSPAQVVMKFDDGSEKNILVTLPSLPTEDPNDVTIVFILNSDELSAKAVAKPGVTSK